MERASRTWPFSTNPTGRDVTSLDLVVGERGWNGRIERVSEGEG